MIENNIRDLVEVFVESVRAEYDYVLENISWDDKLTALEKRNELLRIYKIEDTMEREISELLAKNGYFFDRFADRYKQQVVFPTYVGKITDQGDFGEVPWYTCSLRVENFTGIDYLESELNLKPNLITEKPHFTLINRDRIYETFQELVSNITRVARKAGLYEDLSYDWPEKEIFHVLWRFIDSSNAAYDPVELSDAFIKEFISSKGKKARDVLFALYKYNLEYIASNLKEKPSK